MIEAAAHRAVTISASIGTPSAASAAHRSALASNASTGRAGAAQCRGVLPARNPAATRRWPCGASIGECRPQFEQRHVRPAARRIALRRQSQRRDRRRPQLVQVGGDRIAQPQRIRRGAEQRRIGGGHEAERDALGQALRRQRAPRQFARAAAAASASAAAPARRAATTPAAPRRGRAGAALPRSGRIPARSRRSLAAAFAATAGSRSGAWSSTTGAAMSLRQDGTATVTFSASRCRTREAEALQRCHRLIRRNIRPAERGDAREPQRGVALPGRRRAGLGDRARLAAAQFEDHRGGGFDRIRHQRRIDAALEALARVGDDLVPPSGQRDAHRIEQRAFDEHGAWWIRRSRSPRRRSRRPSTARRRRRQSRNPPASTV